MISTLHNDFPIKSLVVIRSHTNPIRVACVSSSLHNLRWSIGEPVTSSHREAYLIMLKPESDHQAHIQLPLSVGSDPRSPSIRGNMCVSKCRGSGELIPGQRSRQWLSNEARWETNDEEFPWWRAPLRLQKQRTAGNQEVQPEAVSCSLDCSMGSRYLVIRQLHRSAQTLAASQQPRGSGRNLLVNSCLSQIEMFA